KEDLFTYCVKNEFFEDLQDTSESPDDNTNVVNAPQEPFQDPGENSSPSPPHIDHCCHECGDSLDGIFCRQCTCKSCGKGAHYGHNCPPRVPIISNPEPYNTQTISEPLQNLQSLQQQCLFRTCQQCGCNEYDGVCFYCKVGNGTPINDSTPYSSNDSPSVANHPPQNFHGFPQQYPCCENCGGPHETYQCQPMNEDYYHEQNSCYDYNSFGFDQFQPPQYTVNHPIFNSQNELLNSQNELLNSSNKLMEQMTTLCDLVGQAIQKKEEEKRIAEERAAEDRYWKKRVVAVPLLMLIFLNMIRSSLIYRSIHFLLPIGVIFIMRSSPMNSLTSYLHQSMIISALRLSPSWAILLWMW
ncbi:hypothetical protein Tco_0028652, partial [Tanacetum coccineum]